MSFEPEKIKRDHVLKAFAEIDKGDIGIRASTKYDILHQGKTYPPKDTMRLAHEFATGEYLWHPGGGNPTNKYIKALGFQIIDKGENVNSNVKQEFAAWLLRNGPSSYKQYYNNSIEEVSNRLEEINSYFADRNLFLASKESYKDLINYISENVYGNTNPDIENFNKYSQDKGSGIPKAILGKKNYFKFLESKFGSVKTINYWIFQGNPNIYDITNALRNDHLKSWKVTTHKDKIMAGDKIILWKTGEKSGCYALAEVVSEVGMIVEEPEEFQYYLSSSATDSDNDRVKIKITKNLVENPILSSEIKSLPEFASFKAGNQGTNFTATEEEYKTILGMAENTHYTWLPTYKGIVEYLKGKEYDQLGLIQLLKDSGCDLFNDRDENNNMVPLEEIDPLTFFCYINKYFTQRLQILQNLARKIDLPIPKDDFGIPTTNPQKVWLFPYKPFRINNEINRLWSFFYAITENRITEELFLDMLKIKGVGRTKLTEVLFYVDPENNFPINAPTKPYLRDVFDIDPNFESYADYKNILAQIREQTTKPFYQISYEAWLKNIKPVKKNEPIKPPSIMKTPLNQIFFGPRVQVKLIIP
ncbi:EVE domain-containing protein [Aequorivita sp. H23M31]|uniref:EVE domain-containing protein n=1 Tax=Aequorivita ciconiae TaxID=2494375 RepID=A0A410G0S5_9FLAO|nr:EVE domain-containing protein [Aequorivita sp. H23M31]QAA80873.1 EVE domain-containing protein [Aequorivita sp. H23M31]